MKKLCLIALTLVAVSALTVRGAALSEGMHEFRFDVSQSFGNDNGYDTIPIFGSVGYFPIDNLEFGPYFSFRKTDWGSYWGAGSAWGLGLFAEYDMTSGSPLVPFFTARGGVIDGKRSNDTTEELAGGAGFRFFLTQELSIAASLELSWAADEIYDFDRADEKTGDGKHFDVLGKAGIRYLF